MQKSRHVISCSCLNMSKCNLAIKYNTIRLCLVGVMRNVEFQIFRVHEILRIRFCNHGISHLFSSSLLYAERRLNSLERRKNGVIWHSRHTLCAIKQMCSLLLFFLSISSFWMEQNGTEWNGIDSNRFSIMGKHTCECVRLHRFTQIISYFFSQCVLFHWMRERSSF